MKRLKINRKHWVLGAVIILFVGVVFYKGYQMAKVDEAEGEAGIEPENLIELIESVEPAESVEVTEPSSSEPLSHLEQLFADYFEAKRNLDMDYLIAVTLEEDIPFLYKDGVINIERFWDMTITKESDAGLSVRMMTEERFNFDASGKAERVLCVETYELIKDGHDWKIRLIEKERLETEGIIISKEDYLDAAYPLIGAIDHRKIFLYGHPEGVLLRVYDQVQVLDWIPTTPRFILPRLSVIHIGPDEDEAIVCILNVGSGSGVSVDELHVLKRTDADFYEDFIFDDYIEQMDGLLSMTYTEGADYFQVAIGDQIMRYAIDEVYQDYSVEYFILDSANVSYACDAFITIEIPIVMVVADVPTPIYSGVRVNARVDFEGTTFLLSELSVLQ